MNGEDRGTFREFYILLFCLTLITEVYEFIPRRFSTVLQLRLRGYDINTAVSEDYILYTMKLFVEKYPWYYVSASMDMCHFYSPFVNRVNVRQSPSGQK